jgi:hypothetical protein
MEICWLVLIKQAGVEHVQHKSYEYASNIDIPVECIIEALWICLRCNCSTYCGQFWLQENSTAMGPNLSSRCREMSHSVRRG